MVVLSYQMMKRLLLFLPLIAILLSACSFLPVSNNAGLQVFSQPKAEVFLDDQKVGETPYLAKNLKAASHKLKVESDGGQWQTELILTSGTLAVVNRVLSQENFAQQGEILTIEKGQGLIISSNPLGAKVKVNDQEKGQSPLFLKETTTGSYRVSLARDGFLTRSVAVQVHQGFVTTLQVDLALAPPKEEKEQSLLLTKKVVVTATITGWARVRTEPNLTAEELTKVNDGESFTLIEESTGWYKIILTDGRTGWISSQYATIQ